MLTPDEIIEFKRLVKEIMNIDLTYEEAEDQATRLFILLEAIHKFEFGPDVVQRSN